MLPLKSNDIPAPPTQPATRSGVVLAGVVMLFSGYLTANVFCLDELFPGAAPPPYNGTSPLHALLGVSYLGWPIYLFGTLLAIAGLVCVGSQRWSPAFVVAYIFCPIVGEGYLLLSPLRESRRAFVADLYSVIGAALGAAGAGGLWLAIDGQSPVHPAIAGLMLQFGLAALIAGVIRDRETTAPREVHST